MVNDCKEKMSIASHVKCKIFDATGGELSEDDIEYITPEEPLFISQGEDFMKSSSLAIYSQISVLGEGGFGSVYLYEHKLNKKQAAIKFVDLTTIESPEEVNRTYAEIGVLRGLKHPNIVTLVDAFDSDNKICFVMEYCSGGELKDYVEQFGPLPESEVYNLASQIAEAIRYCHNSKVIHRDLKLENILFANNNREQIKIVDFGIAGIFTVGVSAERSDAGSLLYIAPEVLMGIDNRANPALDVWSMGCIFYYMLMKTHPFMAETQQEVIQKIKKCDYVPLSSSISPPWHRLIRGMLKISANKRWNMMRITEHLYKYKYDNLASLSSESEEEKVVEEVKAPAKKRPEIVRTATGSNRPSKSPSKFE